jgi:hypothetical protein
MRDALIGRSQGEHGERFGLGRRPIVGNVAAIWCSRARVKPKGGATAERYSPNALFGTHRVRKLVVSDLQANRAAQVQAPVES